MPTPIPPRVGHQEEGLLPSRWLGPLGDVPLDVEIQRTLEQFDFRFQPLRSSGPREYQ